MNVDPAALERGWRLAESRMPLGTDAVSAGPVDFAVDNEAVMAGVDNGGNRHLLLPIEQDSAVADSSGSAIALRRRSLIVDGSEKTYADVSCSRPDLFDEFAVLCADILETLAADQTDVPDAVATILASWRELLGALAPPRLDRGGLLGLYAELLVLERIQSVDARQATEAWTGPSRGRYDFQRGPAVLEVKGSTARRGRPITIHGLDQLEVPPNASLYLWWIRLEVGIERGESLRAIVNRILDGSLNRAELEQKLKNVGYEFDHEELYERPLVTDLERRLYSVDSAFPKLTRHSLIGAELPRGVQSVSYVVDLSGESPPPLSGLEEQRLIATLAGRP